MARRSNYNILQELSIAADTHYGTRPPQLYFQHYLQNIQIVMQSRSLDLPNGILMIAMLDLPKDEKTYGILHYIIQQRSTNLDIRVDGTTPLIKACQNNFQTEFIRRLIEAGANICSTDGKGYSALHHAAENNNAIIVNKLLQSGANVNSVTNDKKTSLHLACAKNALDVIQNLIWNSAMVYPRESHCFSETTPIEDALIFGFPAAALLVLEKSGYIPTDLFRIVMYRLLKQPSHVFLTTLIQESRIKLFQLLWKTNPKELLGKSAEPLLKVFFCQSKFQSSDWANCLNVMLKSEVASQLIMEYSDYISCHPDYSQNLMVQFTNANVRSIYLTELVQLWSHLGGPVCDSDIIHGLSRYGFSRETESMILAAGPGILKSCSENNVVCYFARILCGLECELNYTVMFSILKNYSGLDKMCEFVLRNFTMPKWLKQKIITDKNKTIIKTNSKNDNFIPLHELSRNAFIKAFRVKFANQRPRDYYNAIDNLKVPQTINKYLKLLEPFGY